MPRTKKSTPGKEIKTEEIIDQDSEVIEAPASIEEVPEEKVSKKTKSKKSKSKEATEADVKEEPVESSVDTSSKKRAREEKEEVEEAAAELPVAPTATKASKPLPPGYKCNACGGSGHAIYDCPNKIAKKAKATPPAAAVEVKAVAKPKVVKEESEEAVVNEANKNKVYVSGLPFDMDASKLTALFRDEDCQVSFVKIVNFEDNSSKCKGFAFVTFIDDASTVKAIAMTGRDMGRKTLSVTQCVDRVKPEVEKGPLVKKPKTPRCFRCGENHDPTTCSNPRICYRCRASDHISSQCPKKKN